MGIIDITDRCNLRCEYCNRGAPFLSHSPAEPSVSEIMDVYEQMIAINMKHIALQGGEPMLRKELPDLLREIGKRKQTAPLELKDMWRSLIDRQLFGGRLSVASYGILKRITFPIVSVTTNGTILDPGILEELRRSNIHLEVSLDTMDAHVHDAHRIGEAGNFQRITRNVRHYAEYVPVILNTTVYEDNVRQMADMVRFAEELGCIHIVFNPLMPTGRSADYQLEWVKNHIEKTRELIHQGQSRMHRVLVEVVLPVSFLTSNKQLEELKREAASASNVMIQFYRCRAYKHADNLYISSALDVFGCPQLKNTRYTLGSLRQSNLGELWNSSHAAALSEQIDAGRHTSCRECDLQLDCNGGCIAIGMQEKSPHHYCMKQYASVL